MKHIVRILKNLYRINNVSDLGFVSEKFLGIIEEEYEM